MPKLLKSPTKSKQPLLLQGSGKRKLSTSRSTGDLLGMLKKEYCSIPFIPAFNIDSLSETKNCQISLSVTKPTGEDLVVCGFLYRLTTTGIWFRLWVELRFNYLMGFYELTDTFPVDVVNLEGYSVRKADECDHLEGLFPIKLCKKGEKSIFFYTESEESRMEWMSNFQFTANQQKVSLNIEGLNLEFDAPWPEGIAKERRNSTVIRNIDNKLVQNVAIAEDEEDGEKLKILPDNFAPINTKLEENIRSKYGRAEVIAQYEALRLSTYYWQRRVSTQIKVDALEEVCEWQKLSAASSKSPERVKVQLKELRSHLEDIESRREKTVRVAKQVLENLESKRVQELRSVNAQVEKSTPDIQTKVKLIKVEQKIAEQHVSNGKQLKTPPKIILSRHTFSPGDWLKTSVKKTDSLPDCDNVFEDQSPSKRSGPLKILSKAVRSHQKKDKSIGNLPSSPSPTKHRLDSTEEESAHCNDERRVDSESRVLENSSPQRTSNRSLPKIRRRISRIFSFSGKSKHDGHSSSSP